jgi:phthalate 4,5-dioxygenase oxygenase subunit
MFTVEENEILTGVGPGKPLHGVLAKYWYPVARSSRVGDRDTLRVRLLAEDWVVARRGSQLLAMEEHCPHRQASLALARVEDCGLRCIYHGWLIGDDGTVLESPNERNRQGRRSASIRTAGVRDVGGLIWLNVEPDAAMRCPFPNLPWFDLPPDQYAIASAGEHANWLQGVEGAIDSSHSSFLHSDEIVTGESESSRQVGEGTETKIIRPTADGRPRIRVTDTDFGFIYAALREPIQNADKEVYVRAMPFAMPSFVAIPASDATDYTLMWVPFDETLTQYTIVKSSRTQKVSQSGWEDFTGLSPVHDIDEAGFLRATSLPGWGQDREAMRTGRSFSGMQGVNLQDFAVQQSMGPIVDRSKENLGPADRAIIHLRRLLLEAAQDEGLGAADRVTSMDYTEFKAREGLIPIDADWKSIYDGDNVRWLDRRN